jgi:hypothetical protein
MIGRVIIGRQGGGEFLFKEFRGRIFTFFPFVGNIFHIVAYGFSKILIFKKHEILPKVII